MLRPGEICSGDLYADVCDSLKLIAEKLSFDFKGPELVEAADASLKDKELQ